MTAVIKTVNAIKNNSSKHCEFQPDLQKVESQNGDVLYFSKLVVVVVVITPPLPRDGGTARTAI